MVRGGGWINVHITNLNTQDLFRKIIHKGGGRVKIVPKPVQMVYGGDPLRDL